MYNYIKSKGRWKIKGSEIEGDKMSREAERGVGKVIENRKRCVSYKHHFFNRKVKEQRETRPEQDQKCAEWEAKQHLKAFPNPLPFPKVTTSLPLGNRFSFPSFKIFILNFTTLFSDLNTRIYFPLTGFRGSSVYQT